MCLSVRTYICPHSATRVRAPLMQSREGCGSEYMIVWSCDIRDIIRGETIVIYNAYNSARTI